MNKLTNMLIRLMNMLMNARQGYITTNLSYTNINIHKLSYTNISTHNLSYTNISFIICISYGIPRQGWDSGSMYLDTSGRGLAAARQGALDVPQY